MWKTHSLYPLAPALSLSLLGSDAAPIPGKVVSCHPQVGNGIRFVKVRPEDRDALVRHIELHRAQQSAEPGEE